MKVSIEELQALYAEPEFYSKTKLLTGEKVHRIEVGGLRHYRRESGLLCKSLTTFLSAVIPKSKILDNWRDRMLEDLGSGEKVDQYVTATADYGTGLHIPIANYCRDMGVNWSEFEAWAFEYLMECGLSQGAVDMAHTELMKDFAALLKFFHDYRVRIIAVEIPVFLVVGHGENDGGIATLIDLVCEKDEKIGSVARHNCIINLKSGKKGFFLNHAFQLAGERMMFNSMYSGILGYEITEIFNLAPKNWQYSPDYKLKHWTPEVADQNIGERLEHYIKIAQLEGLLSTPNMTFARFSGYTKFGESPQPNIEIVNYLNHTKKYLPDVTDTAQN